MEYLKDYFQEYEKPDGKYLMKNCVMKIVEYIFNVSNKNMNLENIYVFVNKYTKHNIYIIKMLVEKFKTVNIITENLKYYKMLENKLYDEGILITVSNNIRKSAKRAEYILNMDYPKETFEKYNINMKSTIINLTEEGIFFDKAFNGVLVNNFEIEIDEDKNVFINEFFGDINKKLYFESLLITHQNQTIKELENNENCEFKIGYLTGVRGQIQNCEFLV